MRGNDYLIDDWMLQEAVPPIGVDSPIGPPTTTPGIPGDPMAANPGANVPPLDGIPNDIANDPQFPDMPEEEEEEQDFEAWRRSYIKDTKKGNAQILIDSINSIRDRDLEVSQRKFVEDNLQINFLRTNSNIANISEEIRRRIKKELDRTNPAVSLINFTMEALEKNPSINETFIKMSNLHGAKGDVHRKFIAALFGAIQFGSGGNEPDIIIEENDFSVELSTRINARFGDITIGKWALKEDDADRYLKPAEMDRLSKGSPEEKDVLRRRIVMESISETFTRRSLFANVVASNGTVHFLGWDIGVSLKNAYTDGKLVVRTRESENSEAIIDDEGTIIPSLDWYIKYAKETGEVDEEGRPEIEEVEFMQKRDGLLFLTAQLDVLQEAASVLDGMVLRQLPWNGNPSDISRIARCIPSVLEILSRQC